MKVIASWYVDCIYKLSIKIKVNVQIIYQKKRFAMFNINGC